jgi:hypothetical protein
MDSQVKNFLQHLEGERMNSEDDWSYVWDGDLGMKRAVFLKQLYIENEKKTDD